MKALIGVLLAAGALATSGSNGGQSAGQVSEATKVFDAAKDSVFSIQTDKASGTGFLCIDNKTVATCYHVIDGAKSIAVKGSMDASWSVTSVRFDEKADIALLTIDQPSSRRVLGIAQKPAAVGEKVYVIGDALAVLTRSLSEGIVSGLRVLDGIPLVQTTAAISPGVSGAPMLNAAGSVVAVVSFTFSKGQALNLGVDSSELDDAAKALPMDIAAFYSKQPAPVSPAQPKRMLDDAQVQQLSRFATQLERAYNEATALDPSASQLTALSDGFSRYWTTASSGFANFSSFPNFVGRVDEFEAAIKAFAAAKAESERIYDNSPHPGVSDSEWDRYRQRYQEALDFTLEKYKSLYAAHFMLLGLLIVLWSDQVFLDALQAPTLFTLYGDGLYVTDNVDPYNVLKPDFAYLDSCVLGEPLLPPGAWKRLKTKAPSLTYKQRILGEAIAQAGETVFAVQVGSSELKDVQSWRDVYKLTTGLKAEVVGGVPKRPRGKVLVGRTRASARLIDVTFGIF